MHILTVKDKSGLGKKAAEIIVTFLKNNPDANMCLPTGNTPLPLYEELRNTLTSAEFTYIALDEYLGLEKDDPRCFSNWLSREILDPFALPMKKRLLIDPSTNTPDTEAKRHEQNIIEHGGIDIAVLGLGHNGHIGFNEPGSAFSSPTRQIKLTERTRKANAAYWGGDIERVPHTAITLGLDILSAARQTILLVSGKDKADILQKSLEEPVTEDIPATYLQNMENVVVIADEDAASKLTQSR